MRELSPGIFLLCWPHLRREGSWNTFRTVKEYAPRDRLFAFTYSVLYMLGWICASFLGIFVCLRVPNRCGYKKTRFIRCLVVLCCLRSNRWVGGTWFWLMFVCFADSPGLIYFGILSPFTGTNFILVFALNVGSRSWIGEVLILIWWSLDLLCCAPQVSVLFIATTGGRGLLCFSIEFMNCCGRRQQQWF